MLLRDEWLRSIHEKCLGPPSLTEDGEPFTKETDRVVAFDPYDSAEDQLESQYEKFENTEGNGRVLLLILKNIMKQLFCWVSIKGSRVQLKLMTNDPADIFRQILIEEIKW